jgi:hypothetical protein
MTWQDDKGNHWNCRLTVTDAKRLKAAGFDLADPKSFDALFATTLTKIELLAELHRPQWEAKQIEYTQFADFLIDEPGRLPLVEAAFVAGLTDFFRRCGEAWMAVVVDKAYAAATKQNEARLAKSQGRQLDALIEAAQSRSDREFEAAVANELARINSGSTSTNAPESSG